MKDGKIELLEQLFMAAHVMDNDGVILWANAFGMNQLGYNPDDFIGHSFSEVKQTLYLLICRQHEPLRGIGISLFCSVDM